MKAKPATFEDCKPGEMKDCKPKWHSSEWTEVNLIKIYFPHPPSLINLAPLPRSNRRIKIVNLSRYSAAKIAARASRSESLNVSNQTPRRTCFASRRNANIRSVRRECATATPTTAQVSMLVIILPSLYQKYSPLFHPV